jgi:hypothetical protein
MLLAKEESYLKKEGTRTDAMSKIDRLYEKVRFPPQHGHTPVPPELEAKPSNASLILGLAGTALSAYGFHKMTAAKATGMEHGGFSDLELGLGIDDAGKSAIPTLPDGNTDWGQAWSTD